MIKLELFIKYPINIPKKRIIIFCLLFTAPGNQFIAYSANKMVDGLHIEIKKGRFLYNNPFNVSFKNHSTDFKAQQLKIDLFWWQCDGLCFENVSARSIKLALGNAPEASQQSNSEPLAKITFPFNIAVKNVAINEFVLNHASADVTVNNFTLAAKAEDATLALKSLTISDVQVKLKEQPASSNQAAANQGQALTALPALPDIEFTSPLNLRVEQFDVKKVDIEQGEQTHTIENIALVLNVEDEKVNLQTLSAQYQQWQLNTELTSELAGNLPLNAKVALNSDLHQANLALSGVLSDLNINLLNHQNSTSNYQLTLKIHTECYYVFLRQSLTQSLDGKSLFHLYYMMHFLHHLIQLIQTGVYFPR